MNYPVLFGPPRSKNGAPRQFFEQIIDRKNGVKLNEECEPVGFPFRFNAHTSQIPFSRLWPEARVKNKNITMNTRFKNALVPAIITCLCFSACDRISKAEKENEKVIPELKGIKLGSSIDEVFAVAFGEQFSQKRISLDFENSFYVSLTANSRIPSVGGRTDYRMTLDFLKDKQPGNSRLQRITVTIPVDSFDGVLQGLTEKYGKCEIIESVNDEKYYNWSLSRGPLGETRYLIQLMKVESRDGDELLLCMTDFNPKNESWEFINESAAKKKVSQSKDL